MRTHDLPSLYIQSPRLNQLNILREVAANPKVTQAELARRCSLSVAMVNNYMKELCAAESIEYHRKTVKSVTYHVTPSGAQLLETLQRELVDEMVGMFAAAKEHLRDRILSQAPADMQRVVIYGTGHLAQLVFHALKRSGVGVVGICDDDIEAIGQEFCGRQVLSLSAIRELSPKAVVVADSARTEEICRGLATIVDLETTNVIRLDGRPTPTLQKDAGLAPEETSLPCIQDSHRILH